MLLEKPTTMLHVPLHIAPTVFNPARAHRHNITSLPRRGIVAKRRMALQSIIAKRDMFRLRICASLR